LLHVILLEWGGVDLDDAVLDEGLRTHQLVVRGVVNNGSDTGLQGAVLAGPGEVAAVEAKCALFDHTPTTSH